MYGSGDPFVVVTSTPSVERRGPDISGLGVHIAARIAETASPGEIRASRTIRDLTLGSKLVLSDHGPIRSKGSASHGRSTRWKASDPDFAADVCRRA